MRLMKRAGLFLAAIVVAAPWLFAIPAGAAPPSDTPVWPAYPVVTAGAPLRFPADHGAHPDYRTEWWYLTGWLRTADRRDLGFQATFFRTRPRVDQRNPSRFAPKQILFAHAALSDPAVGHLLHDQRIARAGFGRAEAAVGDTDIVLGDWRLKRGADGVFRTHVAGRDFAIDLALAPAQPILAQGEGGYSRKGPLPTEASHYFSLPHLKVNGFVVEHGRRTAVTGEAWLDREWSSTLLDPKAVGWNWVGLNLDDGSALTAFQMRDANGRPIWAGGSLRSAGGATTILGPGDVVLTTERRWRSPRTGADYPVQVEVSLRGPSGERRFALTPLFDDQELDGRITGGPVYWEGAVRMPGGRGYLEMTGYQAPLKI
jgi:predicted secreted hydrolase